MLRHGETEPGLQTCFFVGPEYMIRHICVAFLLLATLTVRSQCPRLYDYLGVLTYTPQFINCNGNAYTVGFQSDVSFGSYTVSWGDGTSDHTAASYVAGSVINHTYPATTNSYVLTFTTGTCVLTGTVVNEQAALASILVPSGVGSTLCAPKTLTFTNATTFTSTSTTYTWVFGDGSPPEVHTYTNAGQHVTHTYQKGTVNCETQVTLLAGNYCNFTPSSNSFGPLQVYDIDDAGITPDKVISCAPDYTFSFSNSTQRNCLAQGNTSQRYERWIFHDLKGPGQDSVTAWSPWPPNSARSVAYPGLGSYSVTLLDSNLCGIDVQGTVVNILNPPTAAVIAPTINVCQNTAVTFTNLSTPGAYQHFWNFGTTSTFTNLGAGNKTFTYNTPGTYTVRLIVRVPGASGSCADTAAAIVQVVPSPSASFTMSPVSGCASVVATYTDQSAGAVAWNWAFSNGGTSTLQAPPPQTYTVTGPQVTTLMVTSASGCIRTATGAVIVRNVPQPSFLQVNACVQSPLSFSNTSVAGGSDPITSYTWNFGDGSPPSTGTNPTHTYTLAQTFTVQLKAGTSFCSDSTEQTITIFVKPTASFATTPTVACPPFQAQFTNLSQNAANFLWRFNSAPEATANTTGAFYTYTNTTQNILTHTVSLLAISPAGCIDSASAIVQVRPKPVASFTTNTITGCSPLVTTFSSTGTGGAFYQWDFGDNTASNGPQTSHIYTNTTLFTQTVTATLLVTNSLTCSDTVTSLITVYPEALTVFSMVPQSGCSPLLVNFPGVPGVATYTWDHGDGTGTFTTLTAHSHTFVNNTLADKIFTITLHALTANQCHGSGSGTVMVYHNPIASFSVNQLAGCSPFQPVFANTSSGTISSTNWTFGNGDSSGNSIVQSTFTNNAGDAQKTFEAKLLVSTINGCQDSATQVVTVYPQPLARFTPDTPACSPKIIGFSNQSLFANSYRWFFGDNTSATGDSVTHLYTNAGNSPLVYEAKLVATSQHFCSDSVTVPIRIYPKPQFFIEAEPAEGCAPLTVFFPPVPGVATYEWKYDNTITFGSTGNIYNTFENKLAVLRTYTVQLIGKDAHSCGDTATQLITVYPRPTARFSAKPLSIFIPDDEVTFTNESSTLADLFQWDFGDGNTSQTKDPVHRYSSPGEYEVTLIASTIQGCRDTFALPEKVIALSESVIQLPNAFTPNPAGSPGTIYDPRDLSNDIFHPNVKGADKYTFSIYSRWGELLFETKNPAEGWDGYYRGKLCTQDVYIWKVSATFIDGQTIEKTGDVLLLR